MMQGNQEQPNGNPGEQLGASNKSSQMFNQLGQPSAYPGQQQQQPPQNLQVSAPKPD